MIILKYNKFASLLQKESAIQVSSDQVGSKGCGRRTDSANYSTK